MKSALLYYVALPCSEEVLNLVTLFSIDIYDRDTFKLYPEKRGLFIYARRLELEDIDNEYEWLLQDKDAAEVLALYSNKDFEGICEYLNSLPERPFNVFPHNYPITN